MKHYTLDSKVTCGEMVSLSMQFCLESLLGEVVFVDGTLLTLDVLEHVPMREVIGTDLL